jgi:serine/threonine-protein kinase HipA
MISRIDAPQDAYVWIWLPGATAPVVAGRLEQSGRQLIFNYGRSYLSRNQAISIYEPELPLESGAIAPPANLSMASSIRDAAPDAWGRRVIINRLLGRAGRDADPTQLGELTYLLESGSDRIGALDFQNSPNRYIAREQRAATLEELSTAAARVEQGVPLTPKLDQVLLHGSSIGGARPKAMITDNETKYIAKFSSQNDVYNVIKAEFIAMRLGKLTGLDVAPVKLARAIGKDVLLITRFDRTKVPSGWRRHAMVSALTLLGLDEMLARYASYEDLATIIRHRFTEPRKALRELFSRLSFNILCGNTDDHARNHAAFWNGHDLRLTPAYDICPQARAGNEASQAMLITGQVRASRIVTCLDAAPAFQLSATEAASIVTHQVKVIRDQWKTVCDEAALSIVDRQLFWRRQFLNPFAFEGAPGEIAALQN